MGPAETTDATGKTAPVTVIVRRKLRGLKDAKVGFLLQPRRMQYLFLLRAVALATDAYPPFRLGP